VETNKKQPEDEKIPKERELTSSQSGRFRSPVWQTEDRRCPTGNKDGESRRIVPECILEGGREEPQEGDPYVPGGFADEI